MSSAFPGRLTRPTRWYDVEIEALRREIDDAFDIVEASGFDYKESCRAASTADLAGATYAATGGTSAAGRSRRLPSSSMA